MSALLQVTALSKSFGGVVANEDINIAVETGAVNGLIGPNGSGKTTLFNCIVGYHPVDRGGIIFNSRPIEKMTVAKIARRGLLRTFQQTRIYGGLSCLQNMQISTSARDGARLFQRPKVVVTEKAESLLHFIGLYPLRYRLAKELSFGQQKLLELAMALMYAPKMLLLDEPTAGINPTFINGMIDKLIKANTEMGITLFVIEHNMRVIMSLATHIYCLAHGRLLASGAPEEIRNDQRVVNAYLGAQ